MQDVTKRIDTSTHPSHRELLHATKAGKESMHGQMHKENRGTQPVQPSASGHGNQEGGGTGAAVPHLFVAELGRLHGVDRHVLHLDDALASPAVVLRPLLRRRVLDVRRRARLRRQRLRLRRRDLAGHQPVQRRLCVLHGCLHLLLVWPLQALRLPNSQR